MTLIKEINGNDCAGAATSILALGNRKTGIIYVFLYKSVERWHRTILIDGFASTPVFPRDLPVMNGTQEEHKLSKLDAMSCRLDVSDSPRI